MFTVGNDKSHMVALTAIDTEPTLINYKGDISIVAVPKAYLSAKDESYIS